MSWRAPGITILLVIALLIRQGATILSEVLFRLDPTLLLNTPIPSDPESLLAAGMRIPLRCATQSDLELIPGLPQETAATLLENKLHLAAAASAAGASDALLSLRGIGEKRAALILRHIDLTGTCPKAGQATPLTPLALPNRVGPPAAEAGSYFPGANFMDKTAW